jgi:hypothetical protein
MGMCTHVEGVIPANARYNQMLSIYNECRRAGVTIPVEVDGFFQGEEPDGKGIVLELNKHACCYEYNNDSCVGFEIDITKLPQEVKFIRFFNSY